MTQPTNDTVSLSDFNSYQDSTVAVYTFCARSAPDTILYIGSSNDFHTRMYQHRRHINKGSSLSLYVDLRTHGITKDTDLVVKYKEYPLDSFRVVEGGLIKAHKPVCNRNNSLGLHCTDKAVYMKEYIASTSVWRETEVMCACGKLIKNKSKSKHIKTKRHSAKCAEVTQNPQTCE
jgi:hypothetical protein